MNAHDVLDHAIRAGFQTHAPSRMVAGDALRALQSAGYAVVELPKPNDKGDFENVRLATPPVGTTEIIVGRSLWLTSALARSVAAQLLAAADRAEQLDRS